MTKEFIAEDRSYQKQTQDSPWMISELGKRSGPSEIQIHMVGDIFLSFTPGA